MLYEPEKYTYVYDIVLFRIEKANEKNVEYYQKGKWQESDVTAKELQEGLDDVDDNAILVYDKECFDYIAGEMDSDEDKEDEFAE